MGFAVFDTETTGFNFATSDRIIEIAIVLLDNDLNFERDFTWLVNANRDVGRTDIHGIKSSWLLDAPSFSEIAPTIAAALSNRILVGHNISFDRNFLVAEFLRLGITLEVNPEAWLDTLRLSRDFIKGQTGNSLASLCDFFQIENSLAHSALSDSHATVELFKSIISTKPLLLESILREFGYQEWPEYPDQEIHPDFVRPEIQIQSSYSLVQKLVESLPESGSSGDVREYTDALTRALSDGVVTDEEVSGLVEVAKFIGLGVEDLQEIHQRYFEELYSFVMADGILESDEISLLREAGRVLGVSELEVEQSIRKSSSISIKPIEVGSLVCLTGSMQPEKKVIASLLATNGIEVSEIVSKKTSAVIAADKDSMSGKASKARQYGIPIYAAADIYRIYSQ